VNRFILYWPSF